MTPTTLQPTPPNISICKAFANICQSRLSC